ncbi:protein PRRC2C-like [Thunnus maccoyii]|uniref:protein PRRC2C-like n=1 Tax=Thunnus maccoyii TaxID=8240 RepID=UPI001C4B27BD|nr:protein PRRC2C-like [Thunnus maccoyii]
MTSRRNQLLQPSSRARLHNQPLHIHALILSSSLPSVAATSTLSAPPAPAAPSFIFLLSATSSPDVTTATVAPSHGAPSDGPTQFPTVLSLFPSLHQHPNVFSVSSAPPSPIPSLQPWLTLCCASTFIPASATPPLHGLQSQAFQFCTASSSTTAPANSLAGSLPSTPHTGTPMIPACDPTMQQQTASALARTRLHNQPLHIHPLIPTSFPLPVLQLQLSQRFQLHPPPQLFSSLSSNSHYRSCCYLSHSRTEPRCSLYWIHSISSCSIPFTQRPDPLLLHHLRPFHSQD